MRHWTRKLSIVLVVSAGLCSQLAADEPYFTGLGHLSGGSWSTGLGVSGDGGTVVGDAENADGDREAFRWTLDDGMIGLGFLGGAIPLSRAVDVSADGAIIAGTSRSGGSPIDLEAFRWTETAGMIGLGFVSGFLASSQGTGVSGDGSVVVGLSGSPLSPGVAFRWTATGGMVSLGDLPGGAIGGRATNVSADGSVVVGSGLTDTHREAFRWTESGGMIGLGVLPGYVDSEATRVSAGGDFAVGYCDSGERVEAFRWSGDRGLVGLGFLPDGVWTEAWGVTSNGEVIVGLAAERIGVYVAATVWTEALGLRDLRSLLISDVGLDLSGWTLSAALDITPDGKFIVGEGINPDGQTEAWLVYLGNPIPCWADLNGDGLRDLSDLAILLASYEIDAGGDIDGDGDTDLADLSALLAVYGHPCLH
jgi:probable HAF family extracellular repeat protein